MKYLRERVSYLKGLSDGLHIDENTKEGKVLSAIIEVLDDLALAVDDLEEVQEKLSEEIEWMDEDIERLESSVFNSADVDEVDKVYCPNCDEEFFLDGELLKEGIPVFCPKCSEQIDEEEDFPIYDEDSEEDD